MAKRKRDSDGDSDGDDVLRLTYHREAKYCECVCGQSIGEYHHKCRISIKGKANIETYPCDKSCQTCEREIKSKICADQWIVDEDGYTRCAKCEVKSDDQLPKDCACPWYINKEGKECCKRCHYDNYRTWDEFCGKCECCWLYTDDCKGRICSTCDKEITSIDSCKCDHWYIVDDDTLTCRICKAEHWGNDRPCENCGNDSSRGA